MFYTVVLLLLTAHASKYLVTCSTRGGVCHDGIVNQGLCQKICRNTTCECSMSGQSEISSCTQTCHWLHTHSCPRMSCEGLNSCNQNCFRGECSMECSGTNMCSQSCAWQSSCKHLKCSAKICHQICSNCSMECSRDTERCEQMCESGVCYMACHAKTCRRMCVGKCNVLGRSSHGTHSQRVLQLYELILMVSILMTFVWNRNNDWIW